MVLYCWDDGNRTTTKTQQFIYFNWVKKPISKNDSKPPKTAWSPVKTLDIDNLSLILDKVKNNTTLRSRSPEHIPQSGQFFKYLIMNVLPRHYLLHYFAACLECTNSNAHRNDCLQFLPIS